MEARTFMLWFKLDSGRVKENIEDALSQIEALPGLFVSGKWKQMTKVRLDDGGYIVMQSGEDGSHVVMRLSLSGLLTFDLQQITERTTNSTRPYLLRFIRDGMKKMKDKLGKYCLYAKCLDCPIFRSADPPWCYQVLGDQRLHQLDLTEMVFEKDSEWQNIKICKSQQCGNVLYLDDDVMMGESDLIYTETVLGLGRNDFDGKTVLILGGGDGGMLHELVSRTKVAFVTMAEIDEEVIKACRTHMRSVCGSELDKYEGKNYKIIIGDCMKHFQYSVDNNIQYDYIINDLTEFPASRECFEYDFEMTYNIIDFSAKCLKPSGKYLARGNTISAQEYIKDVERHMKKAGFQCSVCYKYVPSFREEYCFVEAWLAQ